MSIRTKFIIIFIILSWVMILFAADLVYRNISTEQVINKKLPTTLNKLSTSARLDILSQLIRYDDEVLTQSARNYAFTGNIIWKNRYQEFVPKLDSRIKEALDKGDEEDKVLFKNADKANLALIDMETQSFNLTDEGKKEAAQKILDSTEYAKQKAIYKKAIDDFLAKGGAESDESINLSSSIVSDATHEIETQSGHQSLMIFSFLLVMLIVFILIIYFVHNSIIKPLVLFKETSHKIAAENFEQKINIKSKDEIGILASEFNLMIDKIKESKLNIVEKIKERTEDLEKLNRFMSGREIKMIELKKKIAELEKYNENKK